MSKKSGFWNLLAKLLLVAAPVFTGAEFKQKDEVTGVYLARDGGVSSSATGDFTILTDGAIQKYSFEGPLDTVFRTSDCTQLGAIWTLRVRSDGRFTEYQVVRVTCEGNYDSSVRAAVKSLDEYLNSLKKGSYRSAYGLLHQERKAIVSYTKFVMQNKRMDFHSYPGPVSSCLAVRGVEPAREPTKIVISTELDCRIDDKEGMAVRSKFVLAKGPLGHWKIMDLADLP